MPKAERRRRSGAQRRREAAARDPRPVRDGVGPSTVALPPGAWPSLLDFLAARFPKVSREAWMQRMHEGSVTGPDGERLGPASPYRPGLRVGYYRALDDEPPVPFEATVIHRDARLLVADKPHFLPVVPSGRHLKETLLVRLKRETGIDTLAPVHRLDLETAGLVLFTLQPHTRGAYQALFRERRVEKVYEAVAPWRADAAWPLVRRTRVVDAPHFMQMHEVPGEPNAETRIEPIAVRGDRALYRLQPSSGRRHQLRVQMAGLGVPIENDRIYPVLQPEVDVPDFSHPLQLLARSLSFVDPVSGEHLRFESRRVLDFW